ncbi:hypothetical protein PS900_04178 [Pseudomonas fluorescens]|uniref:EAL domain-containing protein n=1 Tax=Pseudomonas fluorescens TaxID=294 RepID=A0A8H2NV25_PSEFL|nr:EAL domain-containing protein [Pseudomonas fluorescens]VVP27479.1 hypothetical protein PS900_04178 [Pseudomonas fluorescens]
MDSTRKYATVNSFAIEFAQKSIFKRDNTVFGSELNTQISGQDTDFHQTSKVLSLAQIDTIHSEALIRSQMTATLSKKLAISLDADTFNRKFISIGQRSLLNRALIEEIIYTSEVLLRNNQKLVINIDEYPLAVTTLKKKKVIIQHVYLLKDNGIELAFSDYDLNQGSAEILNTLNVFNYMKINLQKYDLNKKLNNTPDLFNRFHDKMNQVAHTNKVSFMAERVEDKINHILARSMPFDLFQGEYYSSN